MLLLYPVPVFPAIHGLSIPIVVGIIGVGAVAVVVVAALLFLVDDAVCAAAEVVVVDEAVAREGHAAVGVDGGCEQHISAVGKGRCADQDIDRGPFAGQSRRQTFGEIVNSRHQIRL